MYITEINIYPVKSLGSIQLSQAVVEERGLKWDRRWVVTDPEGQFITQRKFPKMATIRTALTETELCLSAPGQDDLLVPTEMEARSSRDVTVWKSTVPALPVGEYADQWLTSYLDTPCQLSFMPEQTRRQVDPQFARHNTIVSFADGYPLLLANEASLAELNRRLDKPIPMSRFRPNIVVSSTEAFAEDNWFQLRTGETVFDVVKPCSRCIMTTTNQETGQRDGGEPLKTLAKFRKVGNEVMFGQNMTVRSAGIVKVGDVITIVAAPLARPEEVPSAAPVF